VYSPEGRAAVKHPRDALDAVDLGLAGYAETLHLQHRLRDQRVGGSVGDTLLLLEHPALFTCGRGSSPEEFLVPIGVLETRGFGIHTVERGGKTTYHGPGQLVGYPVISLQERGLQVRDYVALLEQCLIESLSDMGLASKRRAGFPGVWNEGRKIAALGVHIRQGVSIHGFAVNLNPDLSHYQYIVPCGLEDAPVTSVSAALGHNPDMARAKSIVEVRFRQVFGYSASSL